MYLNYKYTVWTGPNIRKRCFLFMKFMYQDFDFRPWQIELIDDKIQLIYLIKSRIKCKTVWVAEVDVNTKDMICSRQAISQRVIKIPQSKAPDGIGRDRNTSHTRNTARET